ncbi:MAG: hypothetical protein GQE15_41545 [Archangiaceae bacterium]|nr:hypothetical protein [Archangiaceae bacterium]
MRSALVMVFACFATAACQCSGGETLKLAGPSALLRSGSARFQVSALGVDGQPGAGEVRVTSEHGSLRSGVQVVLSDGVGSVDLTCAPSEDPECAGPLLTLVATWRGQQVEREVRLVDMFENVGGGVAGAGGGAADAGGSDGGQPDAGGFDGGAADAGPCSVSANSSLGCEFLATAVPPEAATRGSCYAVVLANGGAQTVEVMVERDGVPLTPYTYVRLLDRSSSGTPMYSNVATLGARVLLPANRVAVFFLGEEPSSPGTARIACPTPAAELRSFQVAGTTTFPAFRITTSQPVAAYDIYPYGGAASAVASASLLLPTSAWSTVSVGVTPGPSLSTYDPYLQVFAAEDATEVNIEAPVAITPGIGVVGSNARQVIPRMLRRGEVLQLNQRAELGGSTIRSNKPVAVWGGHTCMHVPNATPACDSTHQQLPPVAHLGTEYVALRPPSRLTTEEDALWRLVGTRMGTVLTFTPPQPNAPTSLEPGQTVEFWAPGPFVVRSQDALHPFLATQLMRGGSAFPGNVGDPEFVLLVPPGQFLSSYLFFTDHTYANTFLVFVRRRTAAGSFAPVTLDCGGSMTWLPTGDPDFEYAIRTWHKNDSSGCTNGMRRASSTEPFGLTVWGTDFYVSYAYPAGMGVNRINSVDPDPIR